MSSHDYQPHHTGIEINYNKDCDRCNVAINRTILELKLKYYAKLDG